MFGAKLWKETFEVKATDRKDNLRNAKKEKEILY